MVGQLVRIGLKLLAGLTHVAAELLIVGGELFQDLEDYVEKLTEAEPSKPQEEKEE